MGKILYLECNSGISGDMTVGALLDLGADRKRLEKALESLGIGGYHLHFGRKETCGLDAYDFDVHLEEHDHGESCAHSHNHDHGEICAHSHNHDHGKIHEHSHDHDHGAVHEHDHDYEHGAVHEQDHDHEHGAAHEHSHDHDHVAAHEYGHAHEHGATYEHEHAHAHGAIHDHSHVHRNLHDIFGIIDRLDSNNHVKELARKIFHIVAEAESKAHGLPVDQVHFHEVGAVDSIIDIVSVAVCVDNLGIDDVVVSPLSEGHGHVRCQHGILPVPVPATANIVSGYSLELHFTDNDGEMVTPTGAAIAAALRTRKTLPASCRLLKIGMGAGNKVFRQANVLRAMLLEEVKEEKEADTGTQMWVMETNMDDSTGEMLGFAMEALLAAGAFDVWYTPIFMKKNRPAYELSVLCKETEREKLEDILFEQTTTIGIRRYPVERTVLEREIRQVETSYGPAGVKICSYKGRRFCYPEYESIHKICTEKGVDFQSVYHEVRRAAEEMTK